MKPFKKNKYIIILLIVSFLIFTISCSSTAPTTTVEQTTATQETYNEKLYKNIEISYDIQDIINGKQKIVVYVKNNNKNYAFTGTIHFKATSLDQEILCSDYIYIDDLSPGIKTWAILWGRTGFYDSYAVNFSEIKFREITATSNIAFEEVGMKGFFVFIYTEATKRDEFQQIVNIYKNDKFKSQRVYELDFFNNREKAIDAITNIGMMLPVAIYNYNDNTGLDELSLYN